MDVSNTMAVLLKTASVRVSFIQIMQVRVQNKGKSVWKSRYAGDVSVRNNIEYELNHTFRFIKYHVRKIAYRTLHYI